jgi:hypothetical protein
MSFETLVLNNLKKYKVLAIVGVFLSFFVVVGILNYFQRVTLEGFVSLKQANQVVESFNTRNNTKENFKLRNKNKNKKKKKNS